MSQTFHRPPEDEGSGHIGQGLYLTPECHHIPVSEHTNERRGKGKGGERGGKGRGEERRGEERGGEMKTVFPIKTCRNLCM